jgi:hypothetical protein
MGLNHWSVVPVSVEVAMLSWQETYAAAVLETDNKELEERLAKAEGMIFLRMQDLVVQDCEWEEIKAAWEVMSTLRFERLGWPDYKRTTRQLVHNATVAPICVG